MNRYEEIANKIESEFTTPTYLEQEIRYVNIKGSATICISSWHDLGDYLLVGIAALLHSVQGIYGSLTVYCEDSPKVETIGVAANWDSPIKPVQVESPLYTQVCEPVEHIYQKLYKGSMPTIGIGLSVSMLMMMHFSAKAPNAGIPEYIMSEIKLTDFEDTYQAQKNAFTLIKKITASSVAGSIKEMCEG